MRRRHAHLPLALAVLLPGCGYPNDAPDQEYQIVTGQPDELRRFAGVARQCGARRVALGRESLEIDVGDLAARHCIGFWVQDQWKRDHPIQTYVWERFF